VSVAPRPRCIASRAYDLHGMMDVEIDRMGDQATANHPAARHFTGSSTLRGIAGV
jgi:hypothetical protein